MSILGNGVSTVLASCMLLSMFAALALAGDEPTAFLNNQHYLVLGWFCKSSPCGSSSRELAEELRLDATSVTTLSALRTYDHDWSVSLECVATGTRLRGCVDDGNSAKSDLFSGINVAEKLQLAEEVSRKPSARHVLIHIDYVKGDCATWRCVPTLAPAPPTPVP